MVRARGGEGDGEGGGRGRRVPPNGLWTAISCMISKPLRREGCSKERIPNQPRPQTDVAVVVYAGALSYARLCEWIC